jgi:hypothetical protein
MTSCTPGTVDVEHRQAIDIDAEAQEIEGMQARHQPGGAQTLLRIRAVDRAERGGIRILLHMRRLDALDAAALLVDQHGDVRCRRRCSRASRPSGPPPAPARRCCGRTG